MTSLLSVVRRVVVAGIASAGFVTTASAADEFVYVRMTTTKGDIVLELNATKAPGTVENFMKYVDSEFYNDTIIHRVVKQPASISVIQGGGFTADLKQKATQPPIKNEWDNGLRNERGTIAMARTGAPDSATSQWFINTKDNLGLSQAHPRFGSAGYAVFGKVIGGMEVVDSIVSIPTMEAKLVDEKGREAVSGDVPKDTVTISKAVRVKADEVSAEIASARAAEAEVEKAKAAEAAAAAAKQRQSGEKALAEATEFLKGKDVDPTKGTLTDSGLWYFDVAPGTGAAANPNSTVKAHYSGWLTNGTPFDSSRDGDNPQPIQFSLQGVIRGWTEGVGSMKVGGKRFLVIPPELAYGAKSVGAIPPNSVLVFEVELLEAN